MRAIKVYFADGNTLVTSINGTDAEIRAYYVGNVFNLGREEDHMTKCTRIEFLS